MSTGTFYRDAEIRHFRFDRPPGAATENYIYVLNLSINAVKVGFSTNPEKRIRQHICAAGSYGVTITKAWVSPPHILALSTETELKKHCRKAATVRLGVETFAGIPFDEVVFTARAIIAQAAAVLAKDKTPRQRSRFAIDESAPRSVLWSLDAVADHLDVSLIALRKACRSAELCSVDIGIKRWMPRMGREHIDAIPAEFIRRFALHPEPAPIT